MGKVLCSLSVAGCGSVEMPMVIEARELSRGWSSVLIGCELCSPRPMRIGFSGAAFNWRKFAEFIQLNDVWFEVDANLLAMTVVGVQGIRAIVLKLAWVYPNSSYGRIADWVKAQPDVDLDLFDREFDVDVDDECLASFDEVLLATDTLRLPSDVTSLIALSGDCVQGARLKILQDRLDQMIDIAEQEARDSENEALVPYRIRISRACRDLSYC